ncbi:hypothetical protein [Variovorax paradoxus]|uniref:hypothetical protein n=1 Tax=Variovorax paradoxus TaxID=34073 RepID=UPI00278319B4|nr:hypothetical protein [Variovorax paradoxus]MDQ0585996.1 hypothetical protein [Variovorax paradoxus]
MRRFLGQARGNRLFNGFPGSELQPAALGAAVQPSRRKQTHPQVPLEALQVAEAARAT